MKYAVDPAELLMAAAEVSEAADLAGQASELLGRCHTAGWCPGPALEGAVWGALDGLVWAARRAERHGRLVAAQLVAAAEGYQDADTPRPR